jgi:hypothetical protein
VEGLVVHVRHAVPIDIRGGGARGGGCGRRCARRLRTKAEERAGVAGEDERTTAAAGGDTRKDGCGRSARLRVRLGAEESAAAGAAAAGGDERRLRERKRRCGLRRGGSVKRKFKLIRTENAKGILVIFND